ncbi:MAG: hypothetical protein IT478_03245 [Xanthomonadales bacterium]|nr:hypothetical protein [Xanthomonadales bacterium]
MRTAAAVIAVLFGLATLGAGVSVLAGADPGYLVFRPLLLFNTAMGLAYVGAGLAMHWRPQSGANAAIAIAALNLLVLAAIAVLHAQGGPVAVDSVRAMTLRAGVWVALALLMHFANRDSTR